MSVSEPELTRLPENLPRPINDGAADHLSGQALPPLMLVSTSGEHISLDALGPGRSILYVYPLTGRPDVDLPDGWDMIPGARGCTSEACDFRDHHTQLREAGAARVFGLSSQETSYQRELVSRLQLPFAMLADPQLALAVSVGLPTFATGGMTLYKRLTLVVRDGVIEHVFYPIFPPSTHAQQVLTWLRTAANLDQRRPQSPNLNDQTRSINRDGHLRRRSGCRCTEPALRLYTAPSGTHASGP